MTLNTQKRSFHAIGFSLAGGKMPLIKTLFLTAVVAVLCVSGRAQADSPIDIPETIKISASHAALTPLAQYPSLLGASEKSSAQLRPFTKWSAMFQRLETQVQTSAGQEAFDALKQRLSSLEQDNLLAQATAVNALMNERRYITDNRNWGKTDYWATPVEFLERGGDCEDFAIAKYVALRMLGVPEQRLRLAIVQDTWKNIPHAVLIVYTNSGPYVLDNQNKNILQASSEGRYRPIYSINRQAWWLHKPAPALQRTAAAY